VNYDRSLGIYASAQMMKRKRRSHHGMIRLEVRLEVGWEVDMCFEVVTLIRGMRMWKGRIGTSWELPLSRIGILLFDGFGGVCRVRYSLLPGLYHQLHVSCVDVCDMEDSQTPSPAPRYIFSDELSLAHCYTSVHDLKNSKKVGLTPPGQLVSRSLSWIVGAIL
jgi:hypothetical protein